MSHLADLPHPLPPPHPRGAARLQIRLFGPLVTTYDGAPLRRPSRIDTERLWLRLLVGAGEPTERAQLAADLWPDLESQRARFNLRFHLHHLHTTLPPPDPAAPWIVAVDDTLHWNAEAPAWVDLFAFADDLATADALIRSDAPAAAPLPAAAASALAQAIDLQTGVLLPDHDAPWAAAWRDAVAAAMPKAVDRLVAHLTAAGATDAAVAAAARVVDLDPLDEAAHLRLMTVYAAAGNRTAALQAYVRAVDVLRAELGDEPSEELAALAASLQREPTFAPAEVELPRAVPREGIPTASTPLVGRAADVDAITALLGAHRLVTIAGPAGVGKSAVAAAVARAVADAGRSVAWLDLAALGPGDGIAATATGGVLVFDNADRVVERLGALAPDVIARDAAVRLLVTSRRPLALIGEARYTLRPLDGGDVESARAAALGRDDAPRAVFLDAWWAEASGDGTGAEGVADDRAAGGASSRPPAIARPAATPAQRAAIDAIAGAVDGLPLGLVIAGRAARTLGLDAVAAAIARDALAVVDPTAVDERHRSLGAALAWTLDLVDPGDLAWLRRLAVLAGPLTAAAVEALAEAEGSDPMAAIDALGRLIDAAWLVPVGAGDDGASGHRMLGVVRRHVTA